jgi:proteasome lid subunit RPN8/RPN11
VAAGQEDDNVIELNDWLREELRRRALADDPEECCGLISRGPATDRYPEGRLHLYGAVNAAESPTDSFLIAPRDQIAILKQIETDGHDLVGIYHSHPKGHPDPSQRDRQIARSWPGLTWVIVGRARCLGCGGSGWQSVDHDLEFDQELCPYCGGDGLGPNPDFFAGIL